MNTKRIPVEWQDRTRLRLSLPGEVVALYAGDQKLPKGAYLVDPLAGAIFLTSMPEGDITAEVKDRDVPEAADEPRAARPAAKPALPEPKPEPKADASAAQ